MSKKKDQQQATLDNWRGTILLAVAILCGTLANILLSQLNIEKVSRFIGVLFAVISGTWYVSKFVDQILTIVLICIALCIAAVVGAVVWHLI